MNKINPDLIRLRDILSAIDDIESFYSRGLEDKAIINAICYSIAIIGEAANKLSKNITERNQDIPWFAVIGMRNRIIHEYSGVSKDRIQEVIEDDIPYLKSRIIEIIEGINAK